MRPDRYPTFSFCSRTCQLAGAAIAKRTNGMPHDRARWLYTAITRAERGLVLLD
jgi:hypothetical protein